MASTNRFIEENIPNSITSKNQETVVLDSSHPFSFVRWVEYNKILFTDISDLLQRYQNYVTTWYEKKNEKPVVESITIKDLYLNLLNEVIINYTTSDEKRFLKNIDPTNPRDLAIAVPFFAGKIKDICLYYATLRDKLPNTVVEYNLKGSNYGLESLIYNEISKTLEAQDIVDLIKTINLSVSSVRNNIIVEIEDIYDQYRNYLDVGTLPASAYDAGTGFRGEYFDFNTSQINPKLYLDFDQAIIDAIKSYPFYLIQLGDNFSVNYNVNNTNLNFLKDKDFVNLINDSTDSNLNLNTEASLTKKFIGTDYYYISTGSTGTNYVSGVLFSADSPFANYLNKNTPTVAAVPSLDFLSTAKNIGLFFKPDKIGLLTFANFSFTHSLCTVNLSSNSLYIFPDPDLYGKVSGNTKQDQYSPLTFTENSDILKTDYTNSFKFGEAFNDPLVPTLRGYQSREQTLNYSDQGLSRYIDPQEFFAGFKKDIWANKDTYPLIPAIEFPIDARVASLLTFNNKTVVQYKSDVYGNSYGLYKIIGPPKDTADSIRALQRSKVSRDCKILDGYLFYDNEQGYNFNYETNVPESGFTYSGVILKTVNNIPPGSGYYTPGPTLSATSPLSASAYNNGIPEFNLDIIPAYVESYRFEPDNFCTDYSKTSFDCNIRDGFTFIAPNSALLVDYPSDNSDFNPETSQVYYDILVDGGVNPLGPGYRATFAYQGTFLFAPPLSSAQYNGSFFVVSSFSDLTEPCVDVVENQSGLFLNNYYYDVLQPVGETTADTTQYENAERKTIYETKFETYGDFYYRNANSTLIAPVSTALSGLLIKFSSDIINEIGNKLINFDLYYDFIQFETENYLIFDKIEYNYSTGLIRGSSTNELFIKRGIHKNFEKISTVWFNEKENELIFAATTLAPLVSTSNKKVIYPTIYALNLNQPKITQIYPVNVVTEFDLYDFSLLSANLNIEIVSIDKPLMTYSSETGLYSLTYLARDTSDLFYVFVTTFKYLNGVLSTITNLMYKPEVDVLHNNFDDLPEDWLFQTFTTLGSSAGTVVGGEFVFGA
jgi:hypothetical protein